MSRDPYKISAYGVGYIGEGSYKSSFNGHKAPQYICWRNMLQRCYSEEYHIKQPTYRDCEVCEEWHCYQNFARWYDENYYEVPGKKMQLDKDILIKDNKIYSPETCIFVPQNINSFFTHTSGVHYKIKDNSWEAVTSDGEGNYIYLGYRKTKEEALELYKHRKEEIIKELADKYINYLPHILYEILYNWEMIINE